MAAKAICSEASAKGMSGCSEISQPSTSLPYQYRCTQAGDPTRKGEPRHIGHQHLETGRDLELTDPVHARFSLCYQCSRVTPRVAGARGVEIQVFFNSWISSSFLRSLCSSVAICFSNSCSRLVASVVDAPGAQIAPVQDPLG